MYGEFLYMKARDFLDNCLPPSTSCGDCPPHEGAFKSVEKDLKDEDTLMKQFINCVTEGGLCPKYEFVETPNTFDENDSELVRGRLKADLALYHKDYAPRRIREGEPLKPRWDRMSLYAECKTQGMTNQCDPFVEFEGQKSVEATAEKRRDARGQITAYAAAMFARQHRTHLFSIVVLGESFRLLRWDRAGAIFTERIQYVEKSELLCEFFWRFNNLTRSEQGHDLSAEMITEGSADYALVLEAQRKAESEESYKLGYFKASCKDMEKWPWWKLRVDVPVEGASTRAVPLTSDSSSTPCSTPTNARFFLVGRPHFVADGMAGRGTRGYVAWDIDGERLVYLKDCWRVDAPGIVKEGAVLGLLKSKDVPHVPSLVCDGDVINAETKGAAGTAVVIQGTLTQGIWVAKADEPNPMKSHIHYRLVVEEFGQSLDHFENSRDLVRVVHGCLIGHAGAYYTANILHRDVSAGNILIVRKTLPDGKIETKGLLNDWDLSKETSNGNEEARQIDRTGTWQFMSARLLDNPLKPHQLQDDLESFLHVLIYEGIRFLKHNCDGMGHFMHNYFDRAEHDKHYAIGGQGKFKAIVDNDGITVSVLDQRRVPLEFKPPSFQAIITELFSWFRAFYTMQRTSPDPTEVAGDNEMPMLASDSDSEPPLAQAPLNWFPLSNQGPLVSQSGRPKQPNGNTLELAQKLETHQKMIEFLAESYEKSPWPVKDTVSDQLDPNWKPEDPSFVPITTGLKRSSKRSASQVEGTGSRQERKPKKPRGRSGTGQ
ncbi:hypothetical protein NEOLEDRAFT_1246004 [Neolentinus lepideus HHB14362 ss-1]|uniref:Fungal-type protein kinase domain-containing protein n=1 Tax=Neolentinus lepideus HHB14362 ss-1 TaxID=1314782 RepID=A0A165N4G5_9AGAM|nr:hypothetical protein NEOLEDRAFT_1246004 [Neolentinus lepideus HHB14362 ss-1]